MKVKEFNMDYCGCDDNYCDCSSDCDTCGCDDSCDTSDSSCGCDDTVCSVDNTDTCDDTSDIPFTFNSIITTTVNNAGSNTNNSLNLTDYNTTALKFYRTKDYLLTKNYTDNTYLLYYQGMLLEQIFVRKYLADLNTVVANERFQAILNNVTIGGGSVSCPSDCATYCGSHSVCDSSCDSSCDCGCDDSSCDCGDCGCDDYCGCDDTCSSDGACASDSCLECADCGCDDTPCTSDCGCDDECGADY